MATVIEWVQGKGTYWECRDCGIVSPWFKDTAAGDKEMHENKRKHTIECKEMEIK